MAQTARYRTDPKDEMQERVTDASQGVNTALSTIGLCIDFLAEQSHTKGDEAVEDAREAVRHIAQVMATLRGERERPAPDAAASGVFLRSDPPRSDDSQTASGVGASVGVRTKTHR